MGQLLSARNRGRRHNHEVAVHRQIQVAGAGDLDPSLLLEEFAMIVVEKTASDVAFSAMIQ